MWRVEFIEAEEEFKIATKSTVTTKSFTKSRFGTLKCDPLVLKQRKNPL